MKATFWERVARFWCRAFGHKARMIRGDAEVCLRCNALISTAHSRGEMRDGVFVKEGNP